MTVETAKEQVKTQALSTVRQDFGGQDLEIRGETAASAVAAQAQAAIQARYIYAERHPRNWMQVRADLTTECKRPEFANNKSALYRKPIGDGGVEGLGIRFVEVALRCMKNILSDTPTVFEDDSTRIVRVSVTDLEGNITHGSDIVVKKTVERRKAAEGAYLSVRKNTYGDMVYTVLATDDEVQNKQNALISKALRTQGLRLIPGDLQDECEKIIRAIRKDKAAKDPKAEAKLIADSFTAIHVPVSELEEFLGHSLEQCNSDELVDLRGFYGAIADGEATWKAVKEGKYNKPKAEPETPTAATTQPATQPARGVEAAKEKVKETVAPKKTTAKPAPAPKSEEPPWEEETPVAVEVAAPVKVETAPSEPEPVAVAEVEMPPAEEVEEELATDAEVEDEFDEVGQELFNHSVKKDGVVRRVQFPKHAGQHPSDPPVDPAAIAACEAECARLKQPRDKICKHWLGAEFSKLNEAAVKCLTAALQNVPTTKA